ncbi:hypothetical protein PPERSA_09942 [Pseudocohnilembus persalinus]|uniref:PARG helical domain-containing protein n=1 Tax=Pseudocohnilembus persalinus TaxID=266149 RepID=A0A0V0QK07_PSEPJ|nr:hypothetical protein PPERSA_09942 [Pseudocohnilembus persalinus]|eukprot:KRX02325.1 hypothetical protein PPERSA_09942 [Pseudocohnilembus persalinus]
MEEENDDEKEQEFQFGQNDNNVENQYVGKFFCESYLVQEQSQFFFDKIIPFIADLALQSEFIFSESFLLLTQTSVIQQQNVQLSRLQVASLMSLMFLCANHLQQSQKLPEIFCFAKIFEHNRKYDSISKQKTEKLMFLFSYFQGLMELDQNSLENEQIIFIRQKIEENQNMDFWKFNSSLLTQVNVYQDGEMDDIESMTGQSGQYIKTIFANKNIGGSKLYQTMRQFKVLD